MKKVIIADRTLVKAETSFSFREKIEIVRQLENLQVDVIELPEIIEERVDSLFVRTVASFVKKGIISVGAGINANSVDNAVRALAGIKNSRIRIELPVSAVGLEYVCGKKPNNVGQYVKECVDKCVGAGIDVEFSALDAKRADFNLLISLIKTAIDAGVKTVSVSEDCGETLPDEFVAFIAKVKEEISAVTFGVSANDKNGLAPAMAIMAVKSGADMVKTCVSGADLHLKTFLGMIHSCGNTFSVCVNAKNTELNRIINQIERITNKEEVRVGTANFIIDDGVRLSEKDGIEVVEQTIINLGYDLTSEDIKKVYEEFLRVAIKKNVGAKELDAIISTVAMQVPPTYKLVSYVVNNGNLITTSAHVALEKDGKILQGVCLGEGPVDAAFKAIDEILGHHFELDNFSINSVTEGKEAVGSAIVKLRANGKIYSGSGISTDIIGASIRAYVNAVNKIAYEEE